MRKIIPAVVAGVAVLGVAGGSFAYVSSSKDVTLAVDGAASDVSTMSGTVGELLDSQGIALTDHDVVAPSADTPLTDGTRVAVQYGRQVTITVDGKPQTFWTTATTVDQALQARSIEVAGGELSTSRSAAIGRQGLAFALETLKAVTVTVGEDEHSLKTTGQTVGDALKQAKVTVDADDVASAKLAAPLTDGMTVRVVKVEVKKVTKKKDVAYDTVNKNTDSLNQGETKVDRAGRTGVRTIVYRGVWKDGKLATRKKTSSRVTKQARDKIVLVGTKEVSTGLSNARTEGDGSVWDRLAWCETGQRWQTDSVPGYSGGLGFAHSSWRAYGGSGSRAAGHSREEQIVVAKRILADVGWGAWPACSKKLGLR